MNNTELNRTSNAEMVTISCAEYEEFQAQRKKISELESRVDVLMEALRLARHILLFKVRVTGFTKPVALTLFQAVFICAGMIQGTVVRIICLDRADGLMGVHIVIVQVDDTACQIGAVAADPLQTGQQVGPDKVEIMIQESGEGQIHDLSDRTYNDSQFVPGGSGEKRPFSWSSAADSTRLVAWSPMRSKSLMTFSSMVASALSSSLI